MAWRGAEMVETYEQVKERPDLTMITIYPGWCKMGKSGRV